MLRSSGSGILPRDFAELIARRFALLGDPTRIRLLDALTELGDASVGELAQALGAGHSNVSKHLNLLYGERIVGRERVATSVRYRIVDQQILELCEVVCSSIREQLRELSLLVEPDAVAPPTGNDPARPPSGNDLEEDMSR